MSNRPGRKYGRQQQKKRPSAAAPDRPSQQTRSNRQIWWIGGGVVAVVVVVALVLGFTLGGGGSSAAQTGFAETIGSPLSDFQSPAGDAAVGQQAPVIRAQTFDGEEDEVVTIDPADGTPRVIAFFAHWCPVCQRELPVLAEYLTTNDLPGGVEVVAVSTGYEPGVSPRPSEWFDDEGWDELVLRDSETSAIANGYGLTSFPFFVVVDGDGTVLARVSGELGTAEFEQLIDLAASGGGDASDIEGGDTSEFEEE